MNQLYEVSDQDFTEVARPQARARWGLFVGEQHRPEKIRVAFARARRHRGKVRICTIVLAEVRGPFRQDCLILFGIDLPYLDFPSTGALASFTCVFQPSNVRWNSQEPRPRFCIYAS